MSDPIRELKIAKAQLASLRTELATMAELNASQREILTTVAAERDALVARKDLDAAHAAAATFDDLRPDIDRYGADQWRRGNAGKDPQEFEEWRREQ